MTDIASYIVESSHFLLARLAMIVQEIIELNAELAMIEADAVRARAIVLQQSSEDSSSAARRDRVNMAGEVVEPTATAIELKGTLASLVEEKYFIIRLLDMRGADDDAVGMQERRTRSPGRSIPEVLDGRATQRMD